MVDRIIGLYSKGDERQIRLRLSQTFKYIIPQRLIPKSASGRIAVIEVLKSNQRTREYILEGEKSGKSLTDSMNDGFLEGMQTFDSVLIKLIRENVITK